VFFVGGFSGGGGLGSAFSFWKGRVFFFWLVFKGVGGGFLVGGCFLGGGVFFWGGFLVGGLLLGETIPFTKGKSPRRV